MTVNPRDDIGRAYPTSFSIHEATSVGVDGALPFH